MEIWIFPSMCVKKLASSLHRFTIMQINRSICNSSGSKINLMAVKCGEQVVSALNSLSSDGFSLPGEEKVEALIEEYFFDDSTDDSGSDESDSESVISHILFYCCIMQFPSVGFIGL